MKIIKVKNLLKLWFKEVIKGEDIPYYLISHDFNKEDGMELQDYWEYEVNNFRLNAKKFLISSSVDIKIHSHFSLDERRSSFLVYILNSSGKFAFKMTITISQENENYYISSNNYETQIVAKYVIENNNITQRGIALKVNPNFEIKKMLAMDMEEVSFNSSPDFDGESFASGRYNFSENISNTNFCDFRVYLQNIETKKMVIEKRKVIFDKPDFLHKPFILKDNKLIILDESFPVNIALMNIEKVDSFSYPRDFPEIDISLYERIIVTDAQDNDWIVK